MSFYHSEIKRARLKLYPTVYIVFIFSFFLFLNSSFADPPKISVVYPLEGQQISVYDSTFIFGSVTPNSTLKINGFDVKVYENGAFLAFLPIKPGDFVFDLLAENKDGKNEKKVKVKIPQKIFSTPLDTLRIEKGSLSPKEDMVLTAGDIIQVSFRGTPDCSAYFKIEGLTPDLPITEIPKIEHSGIQSVFDSQETRDTFSVRGIYYGSYMIQPLDQIDSAKIIFKLSKRLSSLSTSGGLSFSYPTNSVVDSINNSASLLDTALGRVTVDRYSIPEIVEFVDSTLIARTGPKLGYTLLYQPSGIKAIANGKIGNWVRLKLAEGEEVWVEKDSIRFLPLGTPIPQSLINFIQTKKMGNKTQVRIPLQEKLPFQVEQITSPPSLILTIYYATSNTDWIRYDDQDDLIGKIEWSQPGKGIYQLKIDLNQKVCWGYNIFYDQSTLVLEIKENPEMKKKLKGLRIAIDPGHSKDPGAVGPTGLEERVANLEIAKKLKKILEKNGAKIFLTREGMEDVPLYDRPKKAIEQGCDILISIHNNALPDGINPFFNNGVSSYYYHPQSELLAKEIQRELVNRLGIPDYGLYYGNLALTRPTQLLAVLVECAFIMVPEQEMLLKEKDFQEKCAEGICQGILNFLEKTKE
jgi:N-acetylmuramoyl-L-alanine amidase